MNTSPSILCKKLILIQHLLLWTYTLWQPAWLNSRKGGGSRTYHQVDTVKIPVPYASQEMPFQSKDKHTWHVTYHMTKDNGQPPSAIEVGCHKDGGYRHLRSTLQTTGLRVSQRVQWVFVGKMAPCVNVIYKQWWGVALAAVGCISVFVFKRWLE